MISDIDRSRFETLAASGLTGSEVAALAAKVRAGDPDSEGAARSLAAALAHAAFLAPERIAEYYDQAAHGWYGVPVAAPAVFTPTISNDPAPLAPEFWADFWGLVNDTGTGMDAGTVTVRTAALGAHLSTGYTERLAKACLAYPGVAAAARGTPPSPIPAA